MKINPIQSTSFPNRAYRRQHQQYKHQVKSHSQYFFSKLFSSNPWQVPIIIILCFVAIWTVGFLLLKN